MAAEPPLFASGAAPSSAALRAAQARLMRDPNLQFSFPAAPTPPPQTHAPAWLVALIHWLGEALAWLGKGLGWIFLAGLAVAAGIVIFFVARELIRTRWPRLFAREARPASPAEVWRPAPD
ncbi:MAG: hypothetical protein ACREEW_11920, partial [Caulobacteraceae bacterium]